MALENRPRSARQKKVNKDQFQSNFSKTKFSTHELWRQKVSSFSDSMKTRDQLELSHYYGSSGLRYSIHTPKSAAGGALEKLLRLTIISGTFYRIKVTNQKCFDQFWPNTLEGKNRELLALCVN